MKAAIPVLMISLVQAPSKLTTFKCGPKYIRILSSEARDASAVAFEVLGLTIFTATVLTFVSFGSCKEPISLASTTTPNCPAPKCFPLSLKTAS